MRRRIRVGFLAAKERKEHKDDPFGLIFFALYVIFRGYIFCVFHPGLIQGSVGA